MATENVPNVDIVEKCENHDCSGDFFHILNKMRIGRKFCDFSLNVDGEVIHVHKLVLAIASPYFAAMFEEDRKEKTETFLKLNDADLIAVKALVKYIYSGVIILTKDNVEQLLRTSDLFQIEWVKQQCIRFLKQSLNSKNCFRIRKFADMQSCKELYDFSHKYIMEHFDDILEQEDLLLLPFEQIRELIKDEQPRPNTENAYKVSMNWINHDPDQRRVHLAELISLIRLPLASTQFLTTRVVTDRLLREDHKCNEFLIEALIFQLTKVDDREAQSSQLTKVDDREAQSSQLTKVHDREAQSSHFTKVDNREAQISQLTKVDDREALSFQLAKVDDREAQSSHFTKVDEREAQSSQLTKVDDREAQSSQLTKVEEREATSCQLTKVDKREALSSQLSKVDDREAQSSQLTKVHDREAQSCQLTKVDDREVQSSQLTKVDEREALSSQLSKVDDREALSSHFTKVDDREAQSSQLTKVDEREALSSQLTKVDDREAQSSHFTKVDNREAQISQLTKVDAREAESSQLTKVDDREAQSSQLSKVDDREALSFHLTKVDEQKCLCKTQTKERQETFYVFLVGGSNVNRMCKVYDISRNIVVPITNMRKKRCKNSAISLSGAIYSIGGHTGVEIKAAECYNPIKKQWHNIAPTNHGHWEFGICTHNDLVYVVGGAKNSTVERYCNATNKWYSCQSMSTNNHITTRAARAKNSIYTLNYGHNGLTSCMRFDPREEVWHKFNKLETTSYGFELVAHDHTLFAIGSDGCRRLDVRTNQWVSMPSMSSSRHGFSAVIYADDIYVLGGRGKSQFTKFVERYNIRKNKWTIIDTVQIEHYLGGAALISGNFRLN